MSIGLYYSATSISLFGSTVIPIQELGPTQTLEAGTSPIYRATSVSSLPILTTITGDQDCSPSVQTREAVAWALLLLMALLLTGLLPINVILFLKYKHRQRRENTTQAQSYEMADNPCYQTPKISNISERNIYEYIET